MSSFQRPSICAGMRVRPDKEYRRRISMKNTEVAAESPRQSKWSYVPGEGHWDEAMLPSGFPRRHWRKLSVAIGRMSQEQLRRRWELGQQLIQANGITYNVYVDPRGTERPWVLDPIPLVIAR